MDEVAGKQPVPDQEEGWFPDPEQEGQERFWDGEGWTDEVRPDGSADDSGLEHLPEHVPELQRALAAATADIDSVEDRLSALFDRSEGGSGQDPRPRPPRVPRLVPTEALEHDDDDGDGDGDDDGDGADVGDDDLLLEDFDEEPEVFEDEDDELDAGAGDDEDDDDDDDEFADLDAALASESPEEL